jgi:MSHA biogenesis protein MshN
MSVINQMLKDLDRRKADRSTTAAMPENVRTVASAETDSGWKMLLALGVLLALAIAGYFAWSRWQAEPQVAQLMAKKPPQSVPQPTSQPAQPATPIVPVPAQPAPTPAAGVATDNAAPDADASASRLHGLERELHAAPAHATEKPKPAVEPSAETNVSVSSVAGTKPAQEPAAKEARPPKVGKMSRDVLLKSMTPEQKSDNFYKQAVTLLQQGRVAEARNTLWQALDENAANHNARQLLVGLLVESKRSSDAMDLLQEGVRIAPEQTGFTIALARLQVETGNRKLGLQTLESGLKYAGDDAEYHAFYAALLQREERHAEAVDHYLAALRQDPANVSWLIGVGISLDAEGKYADAREAFERAKQIDTLTPDLKTFVDQRLAQLKGK